MAKKRATTAGKAGAGSYAKSRAGTRRGKASGSSTFLMSGMLAGTNADLISQSGGVARSFQAIFGSGANHYGPGSTGHRQSIGIGGQPGRQYSIFRQGGDGAPYGSVRRGVSAGQISTAGNTGRTNVSIVLPKVLGPKGFGGNYRLSKGY